MENSDRSDVEAIKEVIEHLAGAYIAGDLETFVDSFTDDAVCMLPNLPPIIGKGAWHSVMRGMFESSTVADHNSTSEDIVVAGDWAFEWHTECAVYTNKATGESRQAYGKGVFIFRREPGDSWKFARYVTNASPAPEA